MRALSFFSCVSVFAALPLLSQAVCVVQSGPQTRALVELYTSEGCSSCPPGDKRLSQLPTSGASAAVPMALHVDYWDYIGWTDPYAKAEFGQRQKFLARANRSQVYTPQFFVSGRALPSWRDGLSGLDSAIRDVQSRPARADISLRIDGSKASSLAIDAQAQSTWRDAPLVLYLALTEQGLSNKVAAGENRGALLKHEYVVRTWLGPYALKDGKLNLHRDLVLAPQWQTGQVQVVAFVQQVETDEILQALSSNTCASLN